MLLGRKQAANKTPARGSQKDQKASLEVTQRRFFWCFVTVHFVPGITSPKMQHSENCLIYSRFPRCDSSRMCQEIIFVKINLIQIYLYVKINLKQHAMEIQFQILHVSHWHPQKIHTTAWIQFKIEGSKFMTTCRDLNLSESNCFKIFSKT